MTLDARRRAERCFALARSTTFPAERKTAISRGEAIANAAGLSLDEFDIPGRARAARPASDRLFEGNGIFRGGNYFYNVGAVYADTFDLTESELFEVMAAAIRERSYSRNRAEEVAAEAARRARQQQERRVSECLNWLFSRGVRVYPFADSPDGSVTYSAPAERPGETLSESDVVRMAVERGWKR